MATTGVAYVMLCLIFVGLFSPAEGQHCEKANVTNGCSVPYQLPFFFKDTFTDACNRHDICYTCGAGYGLTREACDQAFLLDMQQACSQGESVAAARRRRRALRRRRWSTSQRRQLALDTDQGLVHLLRDLSSHPHAVAAAASTPPGGVRPVLSSVGGQHTASSSRGGGRFPSVVKDRSAASAADYASARPGVRPVLSPAGGGHVTASSAGVRPVLSSAGGQLSESSAGVVRPVLSSAGGHLTASSEGKSPVASSSSVSAAAAARGTPAGFSPEDTSTSVSIPSVLHIDFDSLVSRGLGFESLAGQGYRLSPETALTSGADTQTSGLLPSLLRQQRQRQQRPEARRGRRVKRSTWCRSFATNVYYPAVKNFGAQRYLALVDESCAPAWTLPCLPANVIPTAVRRPAASLPLQTGLLASGGRLSSTRPFNVIPPAAIPRGAAAPVNQQQTGLASTGLSSTLLSNIIPQAIQGLRGLAAPYLQTGLAASGPSSSTRPVNRIPPARPLGAAAPVEQETEQASGQCGAWTWAAVRALCTATLGP